jgi:glycosyl-4,4'-diaponeurosporenoate acyltransferase
MQLIDLNTPLTVVIDFVAWFVIHMAVALSLVRVPLKHFNWNHWLFCPRRWEKGGKIYQDLFRIKKWKIHLPDGAGFSKGRGFPKKKLQGRSIAYLTAFVRETCRAELTHWITILFAPLFFLWNPFFVGWIMIVYAALANLPFIMVQRYNRCRLARILQHAC